MGDGCEVEVEGEEGGDSEEEGSGGSKKKTAQHVRKEPRFWHFGNAKMPFVIPEGMCRCDELRKIDNQPLLTVEHPQSQPTLKRSSDHRPPCQPP